MRCNTPIRLQLAKTLCSFTFLICLLGCFLPARGEAPAEGPLLSPAQSRVLDDTEALIDQAIELSRKGEWRKNEPLLRKCLEERERVLGKESPWVGGCLLTLGASFSRRGQYQAAAQAWQRAATLFSASPIPRMRRGYLLSLQNLAVQSLQQGRYEVAEPALVSALAEAEKILKPGDSALPMILNNLGNARIGTQDYVQAERDLRRAEALYEKLTPPNVYEHARALTQLGQLHYYKGQFEQADEQFRRAQSLLQAAGAGETPAMLLPLRGLHQSALHRGRLAEAEAMVQQVLRITSATHGEESLEYIEALVAWAYFQDKSGQLDEAITTLSDAIKRHDRLQSHSVDRAVLLHLDLADYLAKRGDFLAALAQAEEAWRKQAELHREQSRSAARSLVLIGQLQAALGKSATAETSLRKGLAVASRLLPSFHPTCFEAVHALGMLLRSQGKKEEGQSHLELAAAAGEEYLRDHALVGSDEDAAEAIDSLRAQEDQVLSALLEEPTDARLLLLSLSLVLSRKGRAAEFAAHATKAAQLPASARAAAEHLRMLRRRYSTLALAGTGSGPILPHQQKLSALTKEVHDAEIELARMVPQSAASKVAAGEALLQKTLSGLPADAVLIDVVALGRYDLHKALLSQRPEREYAAFVLTPDGVISIHRLGDADTLDRAARRLHQALADRNRVPDLAVRDVTRLLYEPLRARIRERAELFVSPDGELFRVPWAVLREGSQSLIDRQEITYLTSGRDLALRGQKSAQPPEIPWTGIVIFGDPDYAHRTVADAAAKAAVQTRSLAPSGLRPAFLRRLPATRREAKEIASLFAIGTLYLGPDATEERLHAVASPSILHLATHGLFADPVLQPLNGVYSKGPRGTTTRKLALKLLELPSAPLLQSAVALAGATATNPQAGMGEDGVVTALELSGLALSNTQLVVLSACGTGLGPSRPGHGVYGLQRALLAAGAKTVVVSLWNVADAPTQELMTSYYRALLSGKGRSAALRDAALRVRQRHPHPNFWAPFISIGEESPLSGPVLRGGRPQAGIPPRQPT